MSALFKVELRFFAGVREQLGCAAQTIELAPEINTVGQVRDLLIARGGVWASALTRGKPLRMAYQHALCDEAEVLLRSSADQEIAFFPPVTGG